DIFSGAYTKVRYSLAAEGISRTDTKMILSIDTDPSVKELPPVSAVAVKEGIPLKIWEGETMWSSNRPVPIVSGRNVTVFTVKDRIDISKVRLFFVNEEDYNLFRFIHPLYKEK
ncbi:MAG: hypothetical protein FWH45_01900, partial [Methanomassiliicoccaceae archaeon]|nr:hypothetical protein [Methanomassiliicoccaceae archaeon]